MKASLWVSLAAAAAIVAIALPASAQFANVRVSKDEAGPYEAKSLEQNLYYNTATTYTNGVVEVTSPASPKSVLTYTTSNGSVGTGYADLTTGKIGAYAQGSAVGAVRVDAEYADYLTFHVAGADATTVTPIHMIFSLHQVHTGPDSAESFGFFIGDASTSWYFLTPWTPIQIQDLGWAQYSYSFNPEHDTVTFDATWNAIGADVSARFGMGMSVRGAGGGVTDALHTAGVMFDLAPNVTMDSASGVFLSATKGDASAAPEPAAWALMIAGFGLAGGALRRRGALAKA